MTQCRSIKSYCKCKKVKGHKGNHECVCKGSWDKKGKIIRLPDIINYYPKSWDYYELELKESE